MTWSAPGVLVGTLDQLGDGMPTIADDVSRITTGRRDHLTVDYQQAVVVALDVALYQDGAPFERRRDVVGGADLGLTGEVDAGALPLVARFRLDHDR